MMKIAILAALVACAITYGPQATLGTGHQLPSSGAGPNAFNCDPQKNIPSTRCFSPQCTDAIANQINRELNAAFTYLYMAAHFDDNRIARPGMAKFLYESASEERHHAIMMIDYLNSRGVFYDKNFDFAANDASQTVLKEIAKEPTVTRALIIALNLEIEVTNHIYNIVKACDADFHGADFFTDPILAEQHDGVRQLQGAIRAFKDLRGGAANSIESDALAEFIFDKKMLAEGL